MCVCVHVCVRVKNEDYCFLSANQLVIQSIFIICGFIFRSKKTDMGGDKREKSINGTLSWLHSFY